MMRKYAAIIPFAFFLLSVILGSCNFFEPQPIDPSSDIEDPGAQTAEKVELIAGAAQTVARDATGATVTFNGAAGLSLTTADFTVTSEGALSYVSNVSVSGNTVYVTVTFTPNDTRTDKTYTVGIAANSTKIKGSATVNITQAADTRDLRVELTADPEPIIVTSAATEATATFNGTDTAGLGLTAADFTVSTGITIRDIFVGAGKVSVTVSFTTTITTTETYTVGIAGDSTKIKGSATVTITRYPLFSRPPSDTPYTLVEYEPASGIAVLKGYGSSDSGTRYIVTEANLKDLFNAIYTPNAPDTTDTVALDAGAGYPKTAVPYTAAISEKALGLFKITVGAKPVNDKIEITGGNSDLPAPDIADPVASETNLIVIDIGLPDTADNSELPVFYIPNQGLGASGGNYAHIRLRVNKGASLVILADNSLYINGGAGNSCPTGYFNNGCVEVMADGKLRDGAFEGFPLGSEAVILNRLDSYLATGPEPGSPDATDPKSRYAYQDYYSGWLVGPDAAGTDKPRIKWDAAGNDPSDYLEVRPSKLAISANVTVQKGLGLIYSVWFIDDTTVTIDVPAADAAAGQRGLFANGDGYKFYGTTSAKINIEVGSVLHKMFLTPGATDAANFITGTKTITNAGTGSAVQYVGSITGYPEWTGY
jgi:hypothetical protein